MVVDNKTLDKILNPFTSEPCRCLWKGCNLKFSNQLECYIHVKNQHKPKTQSRCLWENCAHSSGNWNNNLNHVKRHFKLIEGCCASCEITFKWKFDLKRHISRFHANDTLSSESIMIKGLHLLIYDCKLSVTNDSIAMLLN